MTISTIHRLDRITGPLSLSQITQQQWSSGIRSMVEFPAGHTDPMFRANQSQEPVIEFTTSELDTLLASVTLVPLAISATPLVTWFKLASTTGNVARATVQHRKITISLGMLHITKITLPHNGRGEANCTISASYDGVNNPFVFAGSSALSGNLTNGLFFGAGPVSINGVSIPGVKSIDIDTGTKLLVESSDGELWPTFVGLEQRSPSVTIKTLENVNWGTLGLQGTVLNGTTGLIAFARKYSATGRVANATLEHIKFQALNGTAIPMDSSGSDANPITDTLKIEPISATDSVVPIVITTGVAIA